MTDFFTRLAERTLGLALTVQPVVAPMFASEQNLADLYEVTEEIPAGETRLVASERKGEVKGKADSARPSVGMQETRSRDATFVEPSLGDRYADLLPSAPHIDAAQDGQMALQQAIKAGPPSLETARRDAMHGVQEQEATTEADTMNGVSTNVPGLAPARGHTAQGSPLLYGEKSPASNLAELQHEQSPGGRTSTRVPISYSPHGVQPHPTLEVALSTQTPVPEMPTPTPTIQVTIGRVEVRATPPPTTAEKPQQRRSGPSVMSLDEYLQRAKGGHR